MGHLDRWAELAAIECPVHLAVGSDDLWMSPERAELTVARIPAGRYTLLNGIGHYPMEEMDTMAELLNGWLRAFGEAG